MTTNQNHRSLDKSINRIKNNSRCEGKERSREIRKDFIINCDEKSQSKSNRISRNLLQDKLSRERNVHYRRSRSHSGNRQNRNNYKRVLDKYSDKRSRKKEKNDKFKDSLSEGLRSEKLDLSSSEEIKDIDFEEEEEDEEAIIEQRRKQREELLKVRHSF